MGCEFGGGIGFDQVKGKIGGVMVFDQVKGDIGGVIVWGGHVGW